MVAKTIYQMRQKAETIDQSYHKAEKIYQNCHTADTIYQNDENGLHIAIKRRKKMTLEEIEDTLGYKVEIIESEEIE